VRVLEKWRARPLRHSRAGGNPDGFSTCPAHSLDSRLHGNDTGSYHSHQQKNENSSAQLTPTKPK